MDTEVKDWVKHFRLSRKKSADDAMCLLHAFEECDQISINSHSISRAQLELISNNRHLIGLEFNGYRKKQEETVQFKEIGIKKASGFPGFCSKHDNELFEKIDKNEIDINIHSIFLLYFRAIAHEFYNKLSISTILAQYEIEDGSGHANQVLRDMEFGYMIGARDLHYHFYNCIEYIRNKSDLELEYISIKFSEILPFAFSFPLNPQAFKEYNSYTENIEEVFDSITISVVPQKYGSNAFLIWPNSARKLVKDILDKLSVTALHDSLFRMAVDHCENLYMNPDWFSSLTQDQQEKIRMRFFGTVGSEHSDEHKIDFSIANISSPRIVRKSANTPRGRVWMRKQS